MSTNNNTTTDIAPIESTQLHDGQKGAQAELEPKPEEIARVETALEEEKTFGTGVQNSTCYQGMDTSNKSAIDVMADKGMKAAVDHMFTGEGGRSQLSYSQMRSRFG